MKKIKLASWNVNGLRAVWRKNAFQDFIDFYNPDILSIQETKCEAGQLTEEQLNYKGYKSVFESATNRKGYSGVSIYSKLPFTLTHATLGKKDFYDEEGRTIVVEFDQFYLINCYFPNGGKSEEHYQYKLEYYSNFLKLAQKLEKKKPVIWCGDVNATNSDIDLARPKENKDKLGCTVPERTALAKFVENFVDVYRYKNDNKIQYTWWDMKTRSREKNVGWRIDYFYVSKSIQENVTEAEILDSVQGSDHCPITIELKIN